MNQLQLNEIVQRIENCFGDQPPLTIEGMDDCEADVLERLLKDENYQVHLQDEHSKQIIRDYLVNAVALGCITDENFSALSQLAHSRDGRASLSLYMLMSSVDAANELLPEIDQKGLRKMRPLAISPPHMVIVGSG